MSEIKFSWRDEDPVALIVLVMLVVVVFFVPWHSCDPLEGLKSGTVAAVAPADARAVAAPVEVDPHAGDDHP